MKNRLIVPKSELDLTIKLFTKFHFSICHLYKENGQNYWSDFLTDSSDAICPPFFEEEHNILYY